MVFFNLLIFLPVLINALNVIDKDNRTLVCSDKFKNSNGIPVTKEEVVKLCEGKRCITKCCSGIEKFFFLNRRNHSTKCFTNKLLKDGFNKTVDLDYSIDIVEGTEDNPILVKRNLKEDYEIVYNSKLMKNLCSSKIDSRPDKLHRQFPFYNGSLVIARLNYYQVFLKHWEFGDFCFEHVLVLNEDGSYNEPFIVYRRLLDDDDSDFEVEGDSDDYTYKSITLLLSCLCLILVLLVYGLIPKLWNLKGMILMAYVATLFVGFFLRAIMFLANGQGILHEDACKGMGIVTYYALLSAFFWMNVMSFDIWWTFRGLYKARKIHRKGEMSKFRRYGLFAWGTPLLLSIAVGFIDYSDLTHMPFFYKPHFEDCFYMNKNDNVIELRHYLYMPMLALLILDLVFFLMTFFNIWRVTRDSERVFNNKESKYNSNQNRFVLYIKLFVVMGLSWILETVQLPWWLEHVAAIYNGLTGVAIFVIFVLKRDIFVTLCERLHIQGEFVDKVRRKSSAATSMLSHDRKKSCMDTSHTEVTYDRDSKEKHRYS